MLIFGIVIGFILGFLVAAKLGAAIIEQNDLFDEFDLGYLEENEEL